MLGFDSIPRYEKDSPYFGALIGRYGNRIAKGRFTLDGQTYKLFVNNGPNSLHGGKVGFDKKVWTAVPVKRPGSVGLALSLLSKDGEEGYPGNLDVTVVYTWTDDDALRIVYTAKTDKDTVFNPTNHSYFNLDGAGNGTVMNTRLMINADRFTPVDKTQIPLGPRLRSRERRSTSAARTPSASALTGKTRSSRSAAATTTTSSSTAAACGWPSAPTRPARAVS